MLQKKRVKIPLELVLIISGMPGVGKTTLALNLVKKYCEFRSLNQMNLLRFATRYFSEEPDNFGVLQEGLRFQTYEEGKLHMLKLAPVIKTFAERQLEKKIPTIIEGIDFYPPCLLLNNKNEVFFDKVLFINLYCSRESTHYSRLRKREVQRQQNPTTVDAYFSNIRKKNALLHEDILQLEAVNARSIDVADLNERQVLRETESVILKSYS